MLKSPYSLFIMISPIPVILNTPILWSQLYGNPLLKHGFGGCLLLIRGKRSLNIIVPSSLSLSPSPLSCYTSLIYCLHHFTLPVCRALGTWSLDTFPWFRSCLWRTSRSPEILIRLICKHSPNARCVWYIYQELPPKLQDKYRVNVGWSNQVAMSIWNHWHWNIEVV